MNILAIGNSFSQDATRYLHQIAAADGVKLNIANLYIGGCSLERHYRNMLSAERAYELQYNGQLTGFQVSLQEALLNRAWDVVTLQQASPYSMDPDSYFPYITELYAYVKKCVPKAKILIHQTWAYEDGSERLHNVAHFDTAADMFAAVETAYAFAAQKIGVDGIIPSGKLFRSLLDNGIEKIHRDTYHASLGLGRYALGLLWYRMLTGNCVSGNDFQTFDEPIPAEHIRIAKNCVDSL
jgi:hypothetical protein